MSTTSPIPGSSTRKVALVTGASSGIGEATALALARAGYAVSLVARRGERLERIAKEIETAGGEALAIAADLAEAEPSTRAAQETLKRFGTVDLLVNNVGFSPGAALEQLTRDEIRHIFDVNLFSSLQLTGEIVPHMRAGGGGRIVNVGSIGGIIAAPLAIPYSATKAALEAASRGMRLELAPWNIKVSLVIPGFVDTAVFDNAREGGEHLRQDPDNPYRQTMFDMDDLAKKNIANALSPEDIAAVIVRAASSRRPRERYFAPFSARLQTSFMSMLPDRLADKVLLRLYKLNG